MRDVGRHSVLGVLVNAVDYEGALARIEAAVGEGRGFAVGALAVHGIMTGHRDPGQRARLNALDLVVPDGQPVRWALNLLHHTRLGDRVYGPNLMLHTCRLAEQRGWPVYLYGSTERVIGKLAAALQARFGRLRVAGAEPSKFRRLTVQERDEIALRIRTSGARITFVGLGCPRQETWAYEFRDLLGMPILAVGAAFDFHAGVLAQAPPWMQRRGLEWAFRLGHEPLRLWRRYLLLNPWYAALVVAQALGRRFDPGDPRAAIPELFG